MIEGDVIKVSVELTEADIYSLPATSVWDAFPAECSYVIVTNIDTGDMRREFRADRILDADIIE